ncbi:hypothetical protein C7M84_011565 [Penaeus vannamei]|uniref:Uncharacterized protein n=1 Tax=Penaeus vannamei TaxID=6689 RepID=A0A3R7SPX1_PENVA|nr:hypothetical protein C7M84_011565 [Penaeus vannamei]
MLPIRRLDEYCTGSIHPQYCGGYGLYSQSGTCSDPWKKLRDLRNSIDENLYPQDNVVRSSWCGYNIACGSNRKCAIDSNARGCVYIQRKYDEARQPGSGLYFDYRDDYRWRPTCSREGFFAEKQCKGPLGEQRSQGGLVPCSVWVLHMRARESPGLVHLGDKCSEMIAVALLIGDAILLFLPSLFGSFLWPFLFYRSAMEPLPRHCFWVSPSPSPSFFP